MFFMIDVINNYMKNTVKNMMFPTGSRSESYEFLDEIHYVVNIMNF